MEASQIAGLQPDTKSIYIELCNRILEHYYVTFEPEEVRQIFDGTDIVLDRETGRICGGSSADWQLWNRFFQFIFAFKGISWLVMMEPLVREMAEENRIELPYIYQSVFLRLHEEKSILQRENQQLKQTIAQLQDHYQQTADAATICPLTHLHNESFFMQFLLKTVPEHLSDDTFHLLIIDMDNMPRINMNYGKDVGDETLRNLAYLINEMKQDNHVLFRLEGPKFAYCILNETFGEALAMAERIRYQVEKSALFVESVTVSIGAVALYEIGQEEAAPERLVPLLVNIGKLRVRLAKNEGMNTVCHRSMVTEYEERVGKVLIADADPLHREILQTALEPLRVHLLLCQDGERAMQMIESEQPDVVLTEILLPKVDGFMLREKMMHSSNLRQIPFIIISLQKTEQSIERAYALQVTHYFKKPYIMAEVLGAVRNLLRVRDREVVESRLEQVLTGPRAEQPAAGSEQEEPAAIAAPRRAGREAELRSHLRRTSLRLVGGASSAKSKNDAPRHLPKRFRSTVSRTSMFASAALPDQEWSVPVFYKEVEHFMKPEELEAYLNEKALQKTFHGYEPAQVREMFHVVTQLYRDLYTRQSQLLQELGNYRWKEEFIQAALVRAEQTAADIEKEAKSKARLIRATADAEAAALRKEAQKQLYTAEKAIEQHRLRFEQQMAEWEQKIRAFSEGARQRMLAQIRLAEAEILQEAGRMLDAIEVESFMPGYQDREESA
ncbi:diguanylate cyclase [Heliophilum fasciatum]|uniref:Stage 0 sporulation protein A homolog n=1 Tax=Heliophilum fasciatum TaxID=35700 RepID=A0A4R2RK27_9FIRM|nr:diguanylate cyclase [Heliophilum fasciatum]MCW2278163.1 diguanylate cyclase (GGDEF)-like protein [Heliophilum fasciatum]TCP64232.1 diguanylate cyclase (GGDEF)-like protein [Heliophilum fasciatum]